MTHRWRRGDEHATVHETDGYVRVTYPVLAALLRTAGWTETDPTIHGEAAVCPVDESKPSEGPEIAPTSETTTKPGEPQT